MESTTEKNIATFTHLSTITQYFIPFGNYIFPIILWSTKKNESEFVDHHGKQVLNFQLSLLLYSLVLLIIAIPSFLISVFNNLPLNALINDHDLNISNFNFEGNIIMLTLGLLCILLFGFLKVAEFFLIIYAAMKTSNGEKYQYPITISFIK
jgi:uncharacterized Tic20 family protein